LETVHTVGVISKVIVVHEVNLEFVLAKGFVVFIQFEVFGFRVFRFEVERVERMVKLL
jgi:hypothetical protein